MSVSVAGLGKGLREPCYPYREAYVFGAELNTPNANNWNCQPVLVEPTTVYNLSTIELNHEVLVCLVLIPNAIGGTYTVIFELWRDADNMPLALGVVTWTLTPGAQGYIYGYYGYNDWELSTNGRHHLNVTVTGPEAYSTTLYFDVVGIGIQVPVLAPVGEALGAVITGFNSASDWFYSIYLNVLDWPSPFWMIADIFYQVCVVFSNLAWAFYDFSQWVLSVSASLEATFSWENVQELIRSWLPDIEELTAWFADWHGNVNSLLTNWWTATQGMVQGWIDAAVSGLAELRSSWDSFWTVTWPSWTARVDNLRDDVDELLTSVVTNAITWMDLVTWWQDRVQDVQGLIDTALWGYANLLEEWDEFKDQIADLVNDPEQWLLDKIESLLVRFW